MQRILRGLAVLGLGLACCGFTVRGNYNLGEFMEPQVPIQPRVYGMVNFHDKALSGSFPLTLEGTTYKLAMGEKASDVTFYIAPGAPEAAMSSVMYIVQICGDAKPGEPRCAYDLVSVHQGFFEVSSLKKSVTYAQLPKDMQALVHKEQDSDGSWRVDSGDDVLRVMQQMRSLAMPAEYTVGFRLAPWPTPLPMPRPAGAPKT